MATQENIDKVRRSIGDAIKTNAEQFSGDGSTIVFSLAYNNVQDIVITVDDVTTTPTSTYAGTGQIQLPTAPSDDAIVIVTYSYAGFLDSVIASLVDTYGEDGAIIECLKDLLASASRRSDYTQGQTKVNASQVFKNIKDLLEMYRPGGSLSSVDGLTVGRRVNQNYGTFTQGIDLSRDDTWSDNNG